MGLKCRAADVREMERGCHHESNVGRLAADWLQLREALVEAVKACIMCGGQGNRMRSDFSRIKCGRCQPWRQLLEEGAGG